MKKLFLFSLLSLCLTQMTIASTSSENNQLEPQLKAKLSDKVFTETEIMQGADNTQVLYFYCIQDTAEKLTTMYPDVDQKTLIDTVNTSCIYPEDRFNLYSILLASSSMKKPISEKQAATFLEKDYAKDGRDQTNAEQRAKIYKGLGLLKK